MDSEHDSGLRERLHQVDRRLSMQELAHEKDMKNLGEALRLQALEYERRLQILNGEAERLRIMQSSYLPREVWDNVRSDFIKEINELKEYKDQMIGRSSIISIVIPVIISGGFWILSRVFK